jgi:2-isopropylmalate synthase
MVLPEGINTKELLELKPWYKPGKWYTSPVTWHSEVRATMPGLPKEVQIADSTLREGEENVSVSFTLDQKVEIARRLSETGVRALDCGYALNPYQVETAKRIISAGVIKKPTSIFLGCRFDALPNELDAIKKAVDKVVKIGVNGFCLICFSKIQTSKEKDSLVNLVEYIKGNHPNIELMCGFILSSGGLRDLNSLTSTTSFLDWQIEVSKIATEAGVDCITIADTMGCASPPAWKYITSQFRKAIGAKKILGVHNHNDYGLAVANALAGVEGGADRLDTVVCGLGDRAGNTSFEEVTLALEALYGINTGIKLENLYALAQYVQEASGVRVQHWKAVVGDRVWAESSHSTRLIQLKREGKDFFEAGMESWNPAIVGQTHRMFFGKVVMNPEVIEGFLRYLKLQYTKDIVDRIVNAGLEEIDRRAELKQDRWLTEEEVNRLCRKMAR